LTLSQEELPISQEELTLSQEELPISQEELPLSQEKLPISQEELPLSQEELPISQEELPVVTRAGQSLKKCCQSRIGNFSRVCSQSRKAKCQSLKNISTIGAASLSSPMFPAEKQLPIAKA
jgi:hypothetical protein